MLRLVMHHVRSTGVCPDHLAVEFSETIQKSYETIPKKPKEPFKRTLDHLNGFEHDFMVVIAIGHWHVTLC